MNSCYNSYMTKTVTINGVDKACDAASWCKKNVHDKWDIKILESDMFSNIYTFEFTDPTEASFFALRWR